MKEIYYFVASGKVAQKINTCEVVSHSVYKATCDDPYPTHKIAVYSKSEACQILSQSVLEYEYSKDHNLDDWCLLRGWEFLYTKKELDAAELLSIHVPTFYECCGETCGTTYDESTACPICGCNRKQVGPLKIRKSDIPKKDICRTVASEMIVSEKFKNCFESYHLKGISFRQIFTRNKPINYYQPECTSDLLSISNKTVIKISPIGEDLDNEPGYTSAISGYTEIMPPSVYRCPERHLLGGCLLSEVYVEPFIQKADLYRTRECYGVKRGVWRPTPVYLCSQKFRQMVIQEHLTGFEFEVAHIV